MNSVAKAALRLSTVKSLVNPFRNALSSTSKRQFTRQLWHMSNYKSEGKELKTLKIQTPSTACSCGCGLHHSMHTKAERELVEFLTEEIIAERKAQKVKTIPSEFEGFKVSLEGAEVTLTKQTDKETISLNFNVNHTVDCEPEASIDPAMDKPEFSEMRSKPQFEVDVIKGKQTLSFTCSFLPQEEHSEGEGYNDIFGIDEVTLYEGEWNDKMYAVAGDVLDGYLYDLLLNFLEEKGIGNDFVEKLSNFSTTYEHSAYIGLLEGLSKFTSGK